MMISFCSTRDPALLASAGEALEVGLASDGGLFIPQSFPTIDVAALPSESFQEMAKMWLHAWLKGTEFEKDISSVVDDALNFSVPIYRLDENTAVLELFHGPTLSFKDYGARTMARLLGQRLARTGGNRIILVATSGDTGSAVADGFAGIDGIQVVLLYPSGGVSEIQERQLIVERPNVQALRVKGSFDDCQQLVKGAFADPALVGIPLSTANSINIGRLLPQMLYYVWAVKHLQNNDIEFYVPSGNLGNMTAGVMTHLAGLSVHGLRAAHNANDFYPAFLLDPSTAFGSTIQTLSNAMDVGAPSKFERLQALLNPAKMRQLIQGEVVSDQDTIASMQRVYEQYGYLADPHTAVGLEASRRFRLKSGEERLHVILSTAHPAKFPEVCERALGIKPVEPAQLAALRDASTNVVDIGAQREHLASVLLGL